MATSRFISVAILLAIAAVLSASPSASAQGGNQNAADVYREAFAMIKQLSPEDSELLYNYRSGDVGLTPQVRAALSRAQPAIRLFERAAAIDRIDWGIDYSQGPATLLPHLAPMRQGTQLLAAEAQARIDAGDPRGAAQLFAATYRMSGQVTDDPVLINSLVGLAMNTLVNNDLNRAIEHGLIGQSESRLILEAAMPVAGADDPLGMVASFQGERDAFATWLKDNYMGQGGMDRFIEEVGPMLGLGPDAASLGVMMGIDQSAFDTGILSYDLALERTIAAVSQEDLGLAKAEVAQIAADAEAGLYGPMAMLMLPSLERCLDSFIKGYQKFDSTIEKLEQIKNDPAAQQELRNAARWYLRAIELWNALPQDQRELIVERSDDDTSGHRDEVVAALDDAQPIIDIVLEAAQIERCSFDIDRIWAYSGLLLGLPHLAGMSDLAHLMEADAARLAGSQEPGDVDARVVAIFRMANHVGMDGQLRSTQAAIEIAEVGAHHVESIEAASSTAPNRQEVRLAIADLASSRFGLAAAARQYPAFSIDWLIDRGGGNLAGAHYQQFFQSSEGPDDPAAFMAMVDSMNADSRAAALTDLQKLVRLWSATVSRIGRPNDECDAARERFNQSHPREFADWLLDPLEDTARSVEEARSRLEQLEIAAD